MEIDGWKGFRKNERRGVLNFNTIHPSLKVTTATASKATKTNGHLKKNKEL